MWQRGSKRGDVKRELGGRTFVGEGSRVPLDAALMRQSERLLLGKLKPPIQQVCVRGMLLQSLLIDRPTRRRNIRPIAQTLIKLVMSKTPTAREIARPRMHKKRINDTRSTSRTVDGSSPIESANESKLATPAVFCCERSVGGARP